MRKHRKGIVGIALSCALLVMTACGKEDGEGSPGREGEEQVTGRQEQSSEQDEEPETDPSGEGRTFCQRDDRGLGEITYGKLSTQGRWFAANGMSGRAEYTFDSGYNITGLSLYYGADDSVYRRMAGMWIPATTNSALSRTRTALRSVFTADEEVFVHEIS